jgi:hypothetical protein
MRYESLADILELKRRCSIGPDMFAPDRTQWIGALPNIVEAIVGDGWGPIKAAEGQPVIILAVDGLAFEVAAKCWSADVLIPLTSVFPSTSTSGWLSSLTGASVDLHRLTGVVYRLPNDILYNAISDEPLDGASRVESPFAAVPNLFMRMQGRRRCISLPGDLKLYPSRWRDALLAGSDVIWPSTNRQDRPLNARAAVAECAHGISGVLSAIRGASILWAFLNLDDYIHAHGYDASIYSALGDLNRQIDDWVGRGAIVVAISDHGMTPASATPARVKQWDEIDDLYGNLKSGGAGRVRWLYPKAGQSEAMAAALRAAFGDVALICTSEELAKLGLLGFDHPLVLDQIGEIVAIATAAEFPSAGVSCRFEHGALTEREMFVPLAIWYR